MNRRQFVKGAMTAASGTLIARLVPNAIAAEADKPAMSGSDTQIFNPPSGAGYKPVITTNGATLPWKMVDGVKVFHFTA